MKSAVVLVIDANADNLHWKEGFLEETLEDQAVICRGPTPQRRCPLLTGHDCSMIHAADGILFELDLDKDESRQILERYTEILDIPIRVVATEDDARKFSSLLSKVEIVTPPIGPAKLDAFAAEVEAEAG